MIAALPMYDLPEARSATDAWWAVLCRHFRAAGLPEVPAALTRTPNVTDSWTMPGLLFTQTCGYPLTHDWSDDLRLVATPHYSAEGCDGPAYRSALIVADGSAVTTPEDLRGKHIAYNADHSQSGFNAPRAMAAPLARNGHFFGASTRSGGHRQSMTLVRSGEADVCAVDCVTWAMHQRYASDIVNGLRVMGWTDPAPCLPFVTAIGQDDDTVRRLRDGIVNAIADQAGVGARQALFLDNAEVLELSSYDVIDAMERDAIARGYSHLG